MYVITGASGNTGNVVARKLLAEKQQVRVIGRSVERLQPLADMGAEVFVCDVEDTAKLNEAFTGARVVYAMIPPAMTSDDYLGHERRIADSLATAVEMSKVEYAVVLSSLGAEKSEGTGPVVGAHYMEGKFDQIEGLNVLHLRPGYFMENTLAQIGIVKGMGMAAGTLLPDLKLQMIATRDIGVAAAESLLKLNFTGQQIRELHGERDISMSEAARVIGDAIGKPDLAYVHLPDEQVRLAMIGMGMSPNVADLLLELSDGLNTNHLAALEKRSPQNTTATSYETFIAEEFVPLYESNRASAH